MRDQPLLPNHPHGARIAEIFSYGWKWLELPADSQTKEWKTNNTYQLKPRTLWSYFQDAARIIGCRFGRMTRYAMLDIDKDSQYLELVPQIKGALETIGIVRTINVRSSWSGGLHIYIPLPIEFPTFSVACAIRQCLEAQGFNLAPGQLETFPNEKPYGKAWLGEFYEYNGHRLPLQPGTGSALVDDDLEPIPNHSQLAHFLALWDNATIANSAGEIGEALQMARAHRRRQGRRSNGSGKITPWKADLEAIIEQGWTGPGQTNYLLKDIACYGVVFEGLKGQKLADYIAKMAVNAPGFFEHCQHQHEIERRAASWANSAQFYWWPLGDPRPAHRSRLNHNEHVQAAARERISDAMRVLKHQAMGIKELGEAIVKEASCSLQTLYKHLDLWHPDQRCVTDQPESVSAEQKAILAEINQSLESTENRSVTHHGGNNEVCNLKSGLLKNLPPQGKERGCGGEEGISTGHRNPAYLMADILGHTPDMEEAHSTTSPAAVDPEPVVDQNLIDAVWGSSYA